MTIREGKNRIQLSFRVSPATWIRLRKYNNKQTMKTRINVSAVCRKALEKKLREVEIKTINKKDK